MATQNVSEEQLQSQFTYIDAVARLLGTSAPKPIRIRSAASRTRRIPSVYAACCLKWATK